MAFTQTVVPIPLTALPVGRHVFGPVSVPAGLSSSLLSLDRTVANGLDSLTVADVLEVQVEFSYDNGTTWAPWFPQGPPAVYNADGSVMLAQMGWHWKQVGGAVFDDNGVRLTHDFVFWGPRIPPLPAALARALVNLTTACTIQGSLTLN